MPPAAMGTTLRDDAATIWSAAIDAVRPERLVAARLAAGPAGLEFDGRPLAPPATVGARGRIVVVGGGKAAGGLAAGIAALLAAGPAGWPRPTGLVSVPEGCGPRAGGTAAGGIELRATRPAGANVPTPAVAAATRDMLALLDQLGPADLAIALVTGGGSALLAAPPPGVPLEEKIAVARFLSAAGATIDELNAVRRAASLVKAGGLARACGAGRLLVLAISDVIGDPLETIASGPCMPTAPCPRRALEILETFGAVAAGVAPRLVAEIAARSHSAPPRDFTAPAGADGAWTTPRGCHVTHLLLGTNATAVAAAATAATRLGYRLESAAVAAADGTADEVGARLAAAARDLCRRAAADGLPRAIVAGGEATVRVPADHGRGGRNQQTALAAVAAARDTGWPEHAAVASIGTDGEDGPTAAAGGCIDAVVARGLLADPAALDRCLSRCDAHDILAATGGLVRTGPTGTNVADVRIVLARP
jgi:glycerate 2-kinase